MSSQNNTTAGNEVSGSWPWLENWPSSRVGEQLFTTRRVQMFLPAPSEAVVLKLSSAPLHIALFAIFALCLPVMARGSSPERIETINHDPGRFHGKEIKIAGRVLNSFAVMGQGVFLIDDGSGRLWVFGDKFGVPGRDAEVEVKGKLEQGFTFHGKNYILILHETHERRDSNDY